MKGKTLTSDLRGDIKSHVAHLLERAAEDATQPHLNLTHKRLRYVEVL